MAALPVKLYISFMILKGFIHYCYDLVRIGFYSAIGDQVT